MDLWARRSKKSPRVSIAFAWPQASRRRGLACRSRRLLGILWALSSARLREWLAAELSGLDLLVVQIDGIHISENLILVAAIGIDGEGIKHPLALMEGATENAAVAQALIDNLIERGLDPAVPRLFIIDGSKALSRAIRRSFGRETAIQRCQIHKARNIMERLPKGMHASVRRALRQAWELDDAARASELRARISRPLLLKKADAAGPCRGPLWRAGLARVAQCPLTGTNSCLWAAGRV